MSYHLKGTDVQKAQYLAERHGGQTIGVVASPPDVTPAPPAIPTGSVVAVLRESRAVERVVFCGSVETLAEHLGARDRCTGELLDPRPALLVAVQRSWAESEGVEGRAIG